MQKGERILLGVFIVAAILSLLGLLYSVTPIAAQDAIVSCYNRTEDGVVFVFSNIPDAWLSTNSAGWYFIGEDVQLSDHTLLVKGLQFDNGYSYAIVGAGDYSLSDTQSTETAPECAAAQPAPTAVPTEPPPFVAAQPSGVTCTVQYPQLILVCDRRR